MQYITKVPEEHELDNLIENQFKHHFGHAPTNIYSAPGRVNLIGEHTDYNDGFVLPAAINFRTWIAASHRGDRIVEAIALDETDAYDAPTQTRFSLDQELTKDPNARWSDYLRGMVNELLNAGFNLSGVNLVITGNVPRGAGLSSSAALENVIALALTNMANEKIDGVTAARLGQAAENNYVGCQCGIMDQMVSAKGKAGSALLLDCRSLETRLVPIPEECALIVVNSNVKRGLVDSEYNTRRQQCEAAANFFGINALRDLDIKTLEEQQHLMDEIVFKRAKHIVTENSRTLAAAIALDNNHLASLSKLMFSSHESMKNDFEITVPEIDTLVDIIRQVIRNLGGVRMTGGGFGGCVIAIVPKDLQNQVIEAVQQKYTAKTGLIADIFLCHASDGAFSQ